MQEWPNHSSAVTAAGPGSPTSPANPTSTSARRPAVGKSLEYLLSLPSRRLPVECAFSPDGLFEARFRPGNTPNLREGEQLLSPASTPALEPGTRPVGDAYAGARPPTCGQMRVARSTRPQRHIDGRGCGPGRETQVHRRLVEAWARDVWAVWSKHHAWVAKLVEGCWTG